MSESRVCEQCGEAFVPAKPWARYCSDNCRLKAHRELRKREDPNAEAIRSMQHAIGVLRAGDDAREALSAVRAAIDAHPSTRPATTTSTKPKPMVESKPSEETSIDRADLLRRFGLARAAGHAQKSIATSIGLSDGSLLSRWASGKGSLSEDRARALADYLGAAGVR